MHIDDSCDWKDDASISVELVYFGKYYYQWYAHKQLSKIERQFCIKKVCKKCTIHVRVERVQMETTILSFFIKWQNKK